MGLSTTVYNSIFKRTSTFALACGASVFFFERTLDLAADTLFDRLNEGKLYKHIVSKF